MKVKTLHGLIEHQAHLHPQAFALMMKKRSLTYGELQDRILKWASVLRDRGVKAGDAYGLVMRNSFEFVITFFALTRLGARAVPVNFLLKADEIAFIFADAGVVGVITQPPYLGTLLEVRQKLSKPIDLVVTGERREDVFSFEQLLQNAMPGPDLPHAGDSNEIAMIIYTSGTTGKPKGAMLTHRNFLANIQQCLGAIRISSRDTFMCLLPMFHSFAWTVCVLLPLSLGSKVVVVESIKPVSAMLKELFFKRVRVFVAVPPIFAALLKIPFAWLVRLINPVRLCISGAAGLPSGVLHAFEKQFHVPLLEGYGLTEASPVISFNPEAKRKVGSVGKPLPGIEVKILDESGVPCPTGTVGEIVVCGDNVMKGYYRQEEATREAFTDSGERWLKTGDLGYFDEEGYLFIADRKKDLIIVKGLNVYPKEIEEVLLSHPSVQEAAVIGVQDETGDELIRAYVTLCPEFKEDKAALMKACRSQLASYKCPREIDIRSELPKNAMGKVLKRTLRDEAKR